VSSFHPEVAGHGAGKARQGVCAGWSGRGPCRVIAWLAGRVGFLGLPPVRPRLAFLQNRPKLLPVHGLGDMAAGMANKPGDLLDRHAVVGQQRDERVPQVPSRPVPAEPGPLANVLEHLPDVPCT
jgi:hypothetical protein